jgi:hypothetical protein
MVGTPMLSLMGAELTSHSSPCRRRVRRNLLLEVSLFDAFAYSAKEQSD